MNKRLLNRACLGLLGLALAFEAAGQGQFGYVVAPAGTENVEGFGSSSSPFNAASTRYQQVFAASEFSSLAPLGLVVAGILFRLDSPTGASFFTTLSSVQINFSTTQRGPDSLSPVFADNIGPDDTMCFGPQSSDIFGAYTPVGSPQSFTITFGLSRRFNYNPTSGNLLMDIRLVGSPDTVPPFDAVNVVGDSVGRVFAFPLGSTSGTVDSLGLVTELGFEIVPEPSTSALLSVGLGLLWLWHCRKPGKGGQMTCR